MLDSVQYLRYFLLRLAAYGLNTPRRIIRTVVMDARCSRYRFVQSRRGLAWPKVPCQPKEAVLLRIFLVDDNAMARAAVKAALQQHSIGS